MTRQLAYAMFALTLASGVARAQEKQPQTSGRGTQQVRFDLSNYAPGVKVTAYWVDFEGKEQERESLALAPGAPGGSAAGLQIKMVDTHLWRFKVDGQVMFVVRVDAKRTQTGEIRFNKTGDLEGWTQDKDESSGEITSKNGSVWPRPKK